MQVTVGVGARPRRLRARRGGAGIPPSALVASLAFLAARTAVAAALAAAFAAAAFAAALAATALAAAAFAAVRGALPDVHFLVRLL